MAEFMIGRLSALAGAKTETARYYETIGLMPAPPRAEGDRRIYDGSAARRLRFIRRARELGFSFDDIRRFLGVGDRQPSCDDVHETVRRHRNAVREKIDDLKRLDQRLSAIVDDCARAVEPCALVDALSRD